MVKVDSLSNKISSKEETQKEEEVIDELTETTDIFKTFE